MAKDLSYKNISTSTTLSENSAYLVPSQKAAKSYIDTQVATKEDTLTKGMVIGAANQITVSENSNSVMKSNVTISMVSDPVVDSISCNNYAKILAATTVSLSTATGATGTIYWNSESIFVCIGTVID